jgi:hypothetical protein
MKPVHEQREPKTRLIATMRFQAMLGVAATLSLVADASALDYVTHQAGGKTKEIAGRVEVEAEDGGVLLLGTDGVLWPIAKEELAGRRKDDLPFTPLARDELAKRLAAELPAGFKFHHTKNFLLAYNTSDGYAQWVGSLYERLFAAFYNYWQRKGFTLHQPQFPLVALVFDDRDSYSQFARAELGDSVQSIIGYYSLRTNRMVMYDLTGAAGPDGIGDVKRIVEILSRPGAERTVATIVHEATHQLAYNSGLQVRFADVPLWLNEGIAIYFESPDLTSARGWRGIGEVNRVNLVNFRKGMQNGSTSLSTILSDDKRFRDPATAPQAYGEAWALTYFLLQTKALAFTKYLQALSEQGPLIELEPEERLALFQQHFGGDLTVLEADFLRFMRRVN